MLSAAPPAEASCPYRGADATSTCRVEPRLDRWVSNMESPRKYGKSGRVRWCALAKKGAALRQPLSRLSKNRSFRKSSAHWRGNPPDFLTFLVQKTQFSYELRGLPRSRHRSLVRNDLLGDFFDTLKRGRVCVLFFMRLNTPRQCQ